MKPRINKGVLIFAGILCVALAGLYLLYSYAFIEINVSGQQSYSYIITRQGELQAGASAATGTVRKLVRRGAYEVFIQKDDASYLKIQETGGFLSTKKVDGKLTRERVRSFVGDNPKPCLYIFAERLASDACGGGVEDLDIHTPATNQQSSYTTPVAGPAADLEAFLPQGDTATAVTRVIDEVDEVTVTHVAYSVSNTGVFNTSNFVTLSGLAGNEIYSFLAFREGFAAINEAGSKAFYYNSFAGQPTALDIGKARDGSLRFRSASTDEDTLVVVYSNAGGDVHFDDPAGEKSHTRQAEQQTSAKKGKSEVHVHNSAGYQRTDLDESVVRAVVCGQDKLCALLATGDLKVYAIGGGNKPIVSLGNALDVHIQNDKLYVTRAAGVFEFDVEKGEGFLVYSFGPYRYCGATRQPGSFAVCVADESGARRALLIDAKQENRDSIDKKIAELNRFDDIKSLSIYKQFLYISPDVGELKYQPATGRFGYDDALRKSAAEAIDREIERLGINTSDYIIINPLR